MARLDVRIVGACKGPLQLAVLVVWLTGILLSVYSALAGGWPYLLPGLLLAFLLLGTWRRWSWVLLIDFVLLGAQLLGAVGSAFALFSGADQSKAAELRTLGVSPTAGFTVNLVLSTAMFALFVWWLARLRGRQAFS